MNGTQATKGDSSLTLFVMHEIAWVLLGRRLTGSLIRITISLVSQDGAVALVSKLKITKVTINRAEKQTLYVCMEIRQISKTQIF